MKGGGPGLRNDIPNFLANFLFAAVIPCQESVPMPVKIFSSAEETLVEKDLLDNITNMDESRMPLDPKQLAEVCCLRRYEKVHGQVHFLHMRSCFVSPFLIPVLCHFGHSVLWLFF